MTRQTETADKNSLACRLTSSKQDFNIKQTTVNNQHVHVPPNYGLKQVFDHVISQLQFIFNHNKSKKKMHHAVIQNLKINSH